MQKIKQLVDEIRELKNQPTHKAALRVYALMENNKGLFADVMENRDFEYLLAGFEKVCHKNLSQFKSPADAEEYNRLCENFLFHCNRLI